MFWSYYKCVIHGAISGMSAACITQQITCCLDIWQTGDAFGVMTMSDWFKSAPNCRCNYGGADQAWAEPAPNIRRNPFSSSSLYSFGKWSPNNKTRVGLRTCTSGRVCSSVGQWRFPMWETPQPRSWLPPVHPSPSPQLWHDSAATCRMLHNVSPRVCHIFKVLEGQPFLEGHSGILKDPNHYWPYRTCAHIQKTKLSHWPVL